MITSRQLPVKRVAIIGSYSPRQCGIATFTYDLRTELSQQFAGVEFSVAALDDEDGIDAYPGEVKWRIQQDCPADYRRVAETLNSSGIDHVLLQHEYGIFGGEAGEYLLLLLRALTMPVVTTVHTILRRPTAQQKRVMDEVIACSSRVIVMSTGGAEILRAVHDTPEWKIEHVPHGVHDLPRTRNPEREAQLKVKDKKTLLTFGLVSPDKGIENVIAAMPAILAKVPDAVYLVVGATHPHVKAHQGEAYRQSLEELVAKLGVGSHVVFHNRYVDLSELGTFLSHADVYVTPYLKPEQITSGTLAYAMGAGRAIISTPYRYAEEVLANDRGVLVPFADPASLATAAVELLTDDARRAAIQERALAYGKEMGWALVASKCMRIMTEADRTPQPWTELAILPRTLTARAATPYPVLTHLMAMTDSTGLFQHATHDIPNYTEGYCIDDNARGLLLVAALDDVAGVDRAELKRLGSRYLAFVHHAFNADSGRFRNFMAYDRTWLEVAGSEDSHGRALWALGRLARQRPADGGGALALDLFRQALPAARSFTSPRAWAYALLGLTDALHEFGDDAIMRQDCMLHTARLARLLRTSRSPDWVWFEDRLAYCNARLPQALMLGATCLNQDDVVTEAQDALEWLAGVQTSSDGLFEPVGSDRPYVRGSIKPRFDQQPVDVFASVSAYLDAARLTRDHIWTSRAEAAYGWFLGDNHLRRPMFDPETGAGFDGLHSYGLNMNRGAESTLSFLHATAAMRGHKVASIRAPSQLALVK
ncbi:MAG: glycosyltransferase family 4 protein [Fimbriimonadaceae bacterium]